MRRQQRGKDPHFEELARTGSHGPLQRRDVLSSTPAASLRIRPQSHLFALLLPRTSAPPRSAEKPAAGLPAARGCIAPLLASRERAGVKGRTRNQSLGDTSRAHWERQGQRGPPATGCRGLYDDQMQLCNLKRRFLLALGLPLVGSACATSGTPPSDNNTKVQEVSRERAAEPVPQPVSGDRAAEPVPQPLSPATAPASIGRCGVDQVREQLCGQGAHSGSNGCPATGEHLTAFGRNLIVSGINIYARDGALRTFVFDRSATDAYRYEVSQSRPDLDLSRDCCYARCQVMKVAASAPKQIPPGMVEGSSCIPIPEGGTRFPAARAAQCPAAVEIGGTMRPFRNSPIKGQCCYSVPQPMMPPHPRGRAARIDGAPRVADVTTGKAWRSAQTLPQVVHLDDDLRARLAARWLQDAQMEHASIAAFARTSLELLAFGAPPELLIEAHEAALDEIAHARVTFALASAYAGRDLGPQSFHEVQRMTPAADWATFARETLVDGCIGETVAAAEAAEAAQRAEDPVIREALLGIAEDEARHAELAWRILGFALRKGGAEVAAVARAAWEELASRDLPQETGRDEDLTAHGILGDAASTQVRAEVLSAVVQPCLDGLLTFLCKSRAAANA